MESLAFIPARGGSKRLPGKNILSFHSKPLIYYTIAFAKYANLTEIIVSTDSDEIAHVACKLGAKVIMRPDHLATDTSTTSSAAKHCLETARAGGFNPDVFITLQPTNPLRPAELYKNALEKYIETKAKALMSVGLAKHKYGKLNEGVYNPLNYSLGSRSQDLSPTYYENGLIYLTDPSLVEREELFGEKIHTISVEDMYSMVDIDDEFDFSLAEFIFQKYNDKFSYLTDL